MTPVSESIVEQAAIDWLKDIGWAVKNGLEIAPDQPSAERSSHEQVVLEDRLKNALALLNPNVPADALAEAFQRITHPQGITLEALNRSVHRMLTEGVTVESHRQDGSTAWDQVRALDFDSPENNDWLAVNQFTVSANKHVRRADIVLFVNGLPLVVGELKNPAKEDTTVHSAFQQLQTYKAEIPSLFVFNEVLFISDGIDARVGTITAGIEWFKKWRTISGDELDDAIKPGAQVAIQGIMDRSRFLELVRGFCVFEDRRGGGLVKKMAGYHQFHAVKTAVQETLRAARLQSMASGQKGAEMLAQPERKTGDRRIGVVWHTQGSGKSLTMAFYAGRIILETAMCNPTIVVLTDRNDLDDQLYGTFSACQDLLRQPPTQATTRADLRAKLSVESGGVIFTTIHKFFPEEKGDRHPTLSDRENIVVIADEAHRSQYDFIDGFARHMRDALPRASFIGFTGTPIELADKNTRAVFGDYISVYDIQQAVEDEATVPIYYESRLAKLELDEAEKPRIDVDFEEATEGEEVDHKEKLKAKWAQVEAIVGAEKRVKLVAKDIVDHFEKRLDALQGKAMIVCMSRRICLELYKEIAALRPQWEHNEDQQGFIKVVMTGAASDPPDWQPHIRNKSRREALATRFRDPRDPLTIVLVRDMWLTGFDAPSLHTMYIDKPMRGHGLMQAIARVNRVFKDKPGGLVVDYLGLAHELREGLKTYAGSGGKGQLTFNQDEAVKVLLEKHEICCSLFHGFDWSTWAAGTPQQTLGLLPGAQDHILGQEDGRDRFLQTARELSQAFALAVPHPEALRVRDDVSFFQTVRAALVKRADGDSKSEEEMDHAIRQIISRAVAPEGVVDIFAAAGLNKPDISILSEEFLAGVSGMPQKNLAVELLRKLLAGEIKNQRRKNVVQSRSFAEMLERAILRYQNRSIEAAQVIQELIELARQMREAGKRGEDLGLTDDEIAFYDALAASDSAVDVLGDAMLKTIARELVDTVKRNVTIDWTIRESVRAKLRVEVKRVLRKYGYPPDKQEHATKTVLEQAEGLSEGWAQ